MRETPPDEAVEGEPNQFLEYHTEFKHPEHLLTLYIGLLDQVNWEEMIRFTDPGPETTAQGIEWIHEVNKVVEKLDCSEITPNEQLTTRLRHHLLPQFWMLYWRDQLAPSQQELEKYYLQHQDDFASARWVKGIRIFIPDGPESETMVQSWKKRLEDSTNTFEQMALTYLKETTSDSSPVFQVKEGLVRQEVFETFWDAPLNQWQGPEKGRTGTLFFEVKTKGVFEKKTAEQINGEISNILTDESYSSYLKYRRQLFREQHEIEMVFNRENASQPTMNDVAYLLDGESYTFAQIKETLPNVMGDEKNKQYYSTLISLGLDYQMQRNSQEVENVLSSPEYKFLTQSLLNQSILKGYLEKLYSSITFTEDDLLKWYEENKMTLYTELGNPEEAMEYSKAKRNVLRDYQWAEKGKIRKQLNLPY